MSEQSQYSAYLELVELPDGDIVLRHSSGAEEPMVLIRFSGESREWLGGARMEVARQMVQAGIRAFNRISRTEVQEQESPGADRRRSASGAPGIVFGEDAAAEQDAEEEMPTVH